MTWANFAWRLGLLWRIHRRRWSVVIRLRVHKLHAGKRRRLRFEVVDQRFRNAIFTERVRSAITVPDYSQMTIVVAEPPLIIQKSEEPYDILGVKEREHRATLIRLGYGLSYFVS